MTTTTTDTTTLTTLLQSLPKGTRLNATIDFRATIVMSNKFDQERLSGVPASQVKRWVAALRWDTRQARLTDGTIEALNSTSGTWTPLFTVA